MLISAIPRAPADAATALVRFVAQAQLLLDPATPEALRCRVEPEWLALLPTVRALGLLDLMEIRDPAMRALVNDELTARQRPVRLVELAEV
ncbi:MAG TPA: hypothetical protein VIM98_07930 [Dyella sp.]|uniref:hypothetical protein n=1 Tax=Dyella sp. TaxID=1869338 RepID=UPI002F94F746